MKKTVVFILCVIFALALASCSAVRDTDPSTAASSPSTPTSSDPSSSSTPTTDGGETPTDSGAKKTLVVYFSASGNTERVAKEISAAANADIFEIVPQDVYTSDDLNWTNPNSRVCREHDDESLRDVPLTSTAVDGWENYDTVYIGYPIWWGIAAWPVDNFVKANDFSGKTVVPFATSSSSGMGQSGTLLERMANGGDWQEGHRFSSGASAADVDAWVSGR